MNMEQAGRREKIGTIKLINKRLKYLRNLSDREYYNLSQDEHLEWEYLSINPAAIEFLEEKIKFDDKIDVLQLIDKARNLPCS